MAKYKSNMARFTDRDAQVIGEFIETNFPSGMVTAKALLERARPKNSPIHTYFDWDDKRAAEHYRLRQAGALIRCVVVMVDNRETRKYTVPIIVRNTGKTHISVDIARETPELWHQVLQKALQEVQAWSRRYETLRQLSPIRKAIKEVIRKHGVIEDEYKYGT